MTQATYRPWTAQLPPLTYDDLIDLHFMLEADELFVQLLATSSPQVASRRSLAPITGGRRPSP